jgi:uncharacterized protein with FMN-binding domain
MARNHQDRQYVPASERGRKLWRTSALRSKAGLVGISSAAILSVYATGYFHTAASEPPSVPAAVLSTADPTPIVTKQASPSSTSRTGTAPTATPGTGTAAAKFVDGTYTGFGSSRHGGMGVKVQVAGGRVTSVEITSCQTKYPCSKVRGLPGQVVSLQSASVKYVSGATDSSRAFAGAVSQALAQAAQA